MKTIKSTVFWIVAIVAIICILGVYKFNFTDGGDVVIPISMVKDVKNLSYVVNGETFNLVGGIASNEIAPGSATKNTLSIFGEPVYGDLNGDGKNDAAILLANNPGGSGTFYYAVLAIDGNDDKYKVTNTLLLGDRIAPQTIEIHDGRAVFNYAIRKAGEPMTTPPSIGKSLWINYDKKTGNIGEWVKDFEGEANPSVMTLPMKKWEWVKTQMNDGATVIPKKSGVFTLTFDKNGKINIGTDCNNMSGKYTVSEKNITFSQMISTMMYCDGSQEQDFAKKINEVKSYMFTSKGELVLEIKLDSGTMVFR